MLLAEGNQQGAFLIRNCESQKGELSLSGELRQEFTLIKSTLNCQVSPLKPAAVRTRFPLKKSSLTSPRFYQLNKVKIKIQNN